MQLPYNFNFFKELLMKENNLTAKDLNFEPFSPDIENGLSADQVQKRKEQGLINHVSKKYSKSYLSIFLGNFCTFFNLLGLIVTVALISINAPLSSFFFVAIYLANIAIGILQEIRAKICIDKLSIMSDKKVKVVRFGNLTEISPNEIVLDEIIYLGLGVQIPTDSQIVSGEVEVNESLLTGESVPVKKRAGDQLFAGSFIVAGNCYAKATSVGADNYVEKLSAKAKKYKKPNSELMGSLHTIIKIIGIIIVPFAVAFMLKAMLISNASYQLAVKGTSSIVIGMIPSGMFLLTSMALAVGVIKLSRHNTLVQDLYSLEMLARVDTICFDKTGTITDGKMNVKELVPLTELPTSTISNAISSMLYALKDDNQTAIAMQEFFGDKKFFEQKKALPFNSKRKMSCVEFDNGETFAFGAPEFVLDDKNYLSVKDKVDNFAKMGLRVLVVAKSISLILNDTPPCDFTPVALIVIEDNVRSDAIETIKWFKENNVAIKVISGDNPITVSEVSKRVGIVGAENYISLENLTDEEVFEVANKYTVFGRVSPEQKAILVKSLKSAGHVTAMTGDGVNDILALKEADCAITVASGSDAARNVSHLVLLDNNFNSMPKVVYEGRRVINNVQSSASLFLMKTLFNMFMAIIMLVLPHFPTSPFETQQMILLEVLVIGLPSFFLSLQPNDSLVKGRFITYVFSKSIPSALLILLSVLTVDWYALACGSNLMFNPYTSMGIYALTCSGVVNLFFICKPFNRYRTVLFFVCSLGVLIVCIIGMFFGLNVLSLAPIGSISTNWDKLILIVALIVINVPLYLILTKLFSKIKFNKR